MSASFLDHFGTLEDPRVERNQRHALLDIVLLTVCAVVSGANGWAAIEDFGRERLDWLHQFGQSENGVASHDCIANVISRLTPKGFGECFRSWTLAVAGATGGEIIAVDGKSARGSRDRRRGRSPLHMVSAWACRNRLVLGQEATEEKSNEITAIPKLLELLELKGGIVTIDAMGSQRAIAEQIRAQGGDYVLGRIDHPGRLYMELEVQPLQDRHRDGHGFRGAVTTEDTPHRRRKARVVLAESGSRQSPGPGRSKTAGEGGEHR
jgi:predicted transposase YbfD/YdcC